MRRPILLLTLLLCSCLVAEAQTHAEDEAALRHLKEVLWPKAYQDQDTALLDQILASEFQMIDASGNIFKKKDELAYIQVVKPSYDNFEFVIDRLDIFENMTAIVAGLGVISGSDEKGEYKTTYHSSNVLIKRDDAWKAVASHVSGIQKNYITGGQ